MNKKYLKLVVGLLMLSCLTACGNKTNDITKSPEKVKSEASFLKLKDGEYVGVGEGFNGKTKVKVKIIDKKIKSIDVVSHEDDEEYFNQAKALIQDIISKQSLEVDTVSGATKSSNGIISSVKDALNNGK
ncbi:FMN-binding protein [Clostridium botulinum]|uniref:FMN-binding protein n=1 Tax=Clostridium botulinum TaxID=1491 RepID=UPI0004D4B6D7|nr:FMN-binding protein [Clostridium botulinum]KEI02534.1 hypothetical protein Z952_09145 [Clostridium botulinum C/D str. BKT75002]KEI12345.1 hypothetical protein Z954_05840 [Clostridium botulinum C/D str. BKT2873]MCD3234726.1 FMN-binding protein [Clostridium botulinum D/C]MCD3240564.1 FMN-binding protein [Clostridium botulinum D/C]MCD3268131.1 FMN-binding protein [Clostridium botulinum D/C]